MSRAHLRIFGKVQGVYFRVTAARQSKTLGLRGWVRNRRNGSVETVVEGEDDVVERYVAWCQTAYTHGSWLAAFGQASVRLQRCGAVS